MNLGETPGVGGTRSLSTAVQALKLGFSRRLLCEQSRRRGGKENPFEEVIERVWETRYYDFNICNGAKRVEKLRYMHRNPVKRGLADAPEFMAVEQLPV
jgi:hypothetical protein